MNSVFVLILLGYITEFQAELCKERSKYGDSTYLYCSNECCGTTYYKYCCRSSSTYYNDYAASSATIYGAVFGTIAGVLILSLIICVCCTSFKKRTAGRVVAINPPSNVVAISNGQQSTITYNNPAGVGQPPQLYTYSNPACPPQAPTHFPPTLQPNPTFVEPPPPYSSQLPGSVNSQPNDASRPPRTRTNKGVAGSVLLRLGIMGINGMLSAPSEDIHGDQELSETLNVE
ncbi:hypothetical protein SNE40_017219 [Patella caerulea]|uniref:Uncharacterized protein n=1 Tax=Patella caerulea TaxID=87958 RepID=A0AAN8PL41_PATCE